MGGPLEAGRGRLVLCVMWQPGKEVAQAIVNQRDLICFLRESGSAGVASGSLNFVIGCTLPDRVQENQRKGDSLAGLRTEKFRNIYVKFPETPVALFYLFPTPEPGISGSLMQRDCCALPKAHIMAV